LAPTTSNATSTTDPILTVKEIANEWRFSLDTVQRLFENEPDVFVMEAERKPKAKRRPKKTLRIPQQVKDRVWRRGCNKRAM